MVGRTRRAAAKAASASTIKPDKADSAPPTPCATIGATKMSKAEEDWKRIEDEVEARCERMMEEANLKAEELQMEFQVQLMFIPPRIQNMSMKQFMEEYNTDINHILQNDNRPPSEHQEGRQQSSVPNTPQSSRNPHSGVFETPKGNTIVPATPRTLQRAVRSGEGLFSATGSPISYGSLMATLDGAQATITKEHPEKEGVLLDLSNPMDVDQLSESSRKQAADDILDLKMKLDSLLKQLQ